MTGDPGEGRFAFPRAELRRRTIRGVAINGGFVALIDGVTVLQGLIVTRLLGPRAIGLYGIVTITVISLLSLKRVGIDEAFVQHAGEEQEEEFQRAFTLELIASAAFALLVCAAAPVLALAYGDHRLVGLTLATVYLPLALVAQAPAWIFVRRMDFVRQRSLQAVVPVVTFVVTVPLAATGFGVWSLVVGPLAGNLAAAVISVRVSPYKLRLRFDRPAARRYVDFALPLFGAAFAALVVAQGQVLAVDLVQGLAGAGFITLAITLTRYVDRADQIVASSIYPAICAVQGRTERLTELFLKSNRATMVWALPASIGIVLFAPDLVHFVLGRRWEGATLLLQGLAAAGALQQVGYNWFSFYRAHGVTGPTGIEAGVGAAAFAVLAVPGLVFYGSAGFVAGRVAAVLVQLVMRERYVRRLMPSVRLIPLAARAAAPVLAAVAATLALRLAWGPGQRTLVQAAVEAAVFLAVFAAVTVKLEGTLIAEVRGALRRAPSTP